MTAKSDPLVSILIPTFNRSHYLDECLYSVLAQDYTDCEVFVRDNDSTDKTSEIIKKYRPRFGHFARFRYKKNETNVGFRDNMVHGVAECRGKYTIILMDDDFLSTRTAISSFVRALEATDKTSLAVAPAKVYREGDMDSSPTEIVDRGVNQRFCVDFSTVPGKEFFLNSWTKYPPLNLSATMFDTQLILQSPWAEWSQRAGLDVNLYHVLSLNHDVAIIHAALAFYRIHGTNDIWSFPVEDSMDSHSHILKWYAYAKHNSNISRASLFVWRLKTVILKDRGPIRWLHERTPSQLELFLHWLKTYSYLHYLVLRYLSPQMIKYDASRESKYWFTGLMRKGMIWMRKAVSAVILGFDTVLHDPDHRVGLPGKTLRFIARTSEPTQTPL